MRGDNCGCDPGPYMGELDGDDDEPGQEFLGQEPSTDVPWWQQVIYEGEQIIKDVVSPQQTQYPNYPYPYGYPASRGTELPAGIFAPEPSPWPWLIGAAAVIWIMSSGRRSRRA